jgi:2-methylcitrate dehydratase PrpD
MSSASETLAEFAAAVRPADLPAPVLTAAKRHLTDVLGVALAAAPLPFADMAARAAEQLGGRGDATVIGRRERLAPAWAALVNGVLAHGLDFDDTHEEAVVHVSASVAPAALAAGEAEGVDGARFLAALALGMETNVRLGLTAPGVFHDRGFHPTGVCGAYACAVVAGVIGRLSAAQLADALGLAGSTASGTMEFLTDGTWAKRVHAGWAAHGGLVAAALARHGFSGPRGTFDGRFGLYRSHLGEGGWALDAITRDLGRRWHLLEIALKPYPCCHMTHAFIDCAAALRREAGVTPDAIAAIECFIHPREMPVVSEPEAGKRRPQTDYDAKFSLPYTVAAMFVRGAVGLDDFTDAAIRDAEVLSLAARVRSVPDPGANYPHCFPGRMRLTLGDGRVLEHAEPVNRGSAGRPMSDVEVREKFRANAAQALPPERHDTLLAAIDGLERAPDLSALTSSLSREREGRGERDQ